MNVKMEITWISAILCVVVVVLLIASPSVLNIVQRQQMVSGGGTKYVLITGCDSGFGRALAIHLDSLQVPVIAGCLTSKGLDQLSLEALYLTLTFNIIVIIIILFNNTSLID